MMNKIEIIGVIITRLLSYQVLYLPGEIGPEAAKGSFSIDDVRLDMTSIYH